MSFFIFYFLLILIIMSSLLVILTNSPIQSVLFLILVFLLSSILFLIIGAEFLAILLLTVYVGAISILFLFIVMMLNLRIVELYSTIYYYIPIGSVVGLFFIIIWSFAILSNFGFVQFSWFHNEPYFNLWLSSIYFRSNLHLIGEVFFNYCISFFFIAGLILFIVMIGVIVLTIEFEYHRQQRKLENFVIYSPLSDNRDGESLVLLTKQYQLPWNSIDYDFRWFSDYRKWPFHYFFSDYTNIYWSSRDFSNIWEEREYADYSDKEFELHCEEVFSKYWYFRFLWEKLIIETDEDLIRYRAFCKEQRELNPPYRVKLYRFFMTYVKKLYHFFLNYIKKLYKYICDILRKLF